MGLAFVLDAYLFLRVLADDFPFLPSQILVSAFPALDSARGVSHSAVSAYFHVEPMLLGKRFFEGVHYWQSCLFSVS